MDWDILGTVQDEDEVFTIPAETRPQHLYVLGTTGTGKSTLLARLALSDIERGDGLLVLDPHGDLVEDIIDHCPDEHRDRLIYWDPTDREYPVPMNIFECDAGVDPDLVCSEVISVFKHLFGDSWGFHLEDLLRNDALTMIDHQLLDSKDKRIPQAHRYNATLREAHDILYDAQLRHSYYPYIRSDMVRIYWTHLYDRLGSKRVDDVNTSQIRHSSSVSNKLRRFLLNPLVFDIVANRDRKSAFNLRSIMDDRRVLLVNLSRGQLGADNSELLGSVILSRLVVATLSRANLPRSERQSAPFHVIADEFHTYAKDSIKVLLAEARKYGVTLTLAQQNRDQTDLEMKSSVLTTGSFICMRTTGKDADDVARQFDFTPTSQGWRYEPNLTLEPEQNHDVPDIETCALRTPEGAALGADLKSLESHLSHVRKQRDKLKSKNPTSLTEDERRLGDDDALYNVIHAYRQVIWAIRGRLVEIGRPIFDRLQRESAAQHGYDGLFQRNGLDTFRRVPVPQSYGDRERQIANDITQLRNFTALARRPDGVQVAIATLPLPPDSLDRDERIECMRETTRNKYALKRHERPSANQLGFFRGVRSDQAEKYEAELEEQPGP